MKTIVTAALSVFTLAVFMQVQGIATEPANALPTPPAPSAPELWNVWGEAQVDGLVWSVRPVQGAEGDDSTLWVEISLHNPTMDLATGNIVVRLNGENADTFSRMPPTPYPINAQNVTLQAAAGETVSRVLTLALPEPAPNRLTLVLGGDGVDVYSGQTVAHFSSWDPFADETALIF